MICKRCNTDNPDNAGYCGNCGASFDEMSSARKDKECSNCGRMNKPDARFCAKCGTDLNSPHRVKNVHYSTHSSKSQENKKSKKNPFFDKVLRRNPMVVTLVIIGGTILFVSLLYIIRQSQIPDPVQFTEQKSNDPALEARVMQVASKFICSCGTCGEKPLDTCTCNTAAEERQAIRNYLQAGQSNDQVIVALNNMFGWIKPEFASKYVSKDDTSNQPTDISAQNQNSEISSKGLQLSSKVHLATMADRLEIFSHFKCPCGQCGMDELKDCTCDHPRGAKEVKEFVDRKITKGTLTVTQVVDDVEKVYGSKKF